jgi:hypothetical protein
MSDDFEDPPLEYPNSDTEENCWDSTSDAEPATSDKWAPDCLKLFVEYRIDPNTSGKGGLAPETPKAAWVSQETVKLPKTQRVPGNLQAKVELELNL